ncbi:unnamed protein product [Sphacelaria rigidula]
MVSSRKAEFCAKHAREGMIQVVNKVCGNAGCSTRPSYGVVGSRKAEFCAKHAKQGMVNVVTKVCGNNGGSTQPSHGIVSSGKSGFCTKHARELMFDVTRNVRGKDGCSTVPSYGVVSNRNAKVCTRYNTESVVHVPEELSGSGGCLRPYRLAGSRKSDFRIEHAMADMIDVEKISCASRGGSKQPRDGLPGTGKAESCVHARIGVLRFDSGECASKEYRGYESSVGPRDAASMTADRVYIRENVRNGGIPDHAVTEDGHGMHVNVDGRGTSNRSSGAYSRPATECSGSRGCALPESDTRSDGAPPPGLAQCAIMVHRDVDWVNMGAKVELKSTPVSSGAYGAKAAATTCGKTVISASIGSSIDRSNNCSASSRTAKRPRTTMSVASRQVVPADDMNIKGDRESVKLELGVSQRVP